MIALFFNDFKQISSCKDETDTLSFNYFYNRHRILLILRSETMNFVSQKLPIFFAVTILGLGINDTQKTQAATLGSLLQHETIKEIQLQFNEILIIPDANTNRTNITIESQINLINSNDQILEDAFFTVQELELASQASKIGVSLTFGGLSLFKNGLTISDQTITDNKNVFTADQSAPNFNKIVDLLKDNDDNTVEFKAILLGGHFPSFTHNTTEYNAFILSTPPVKPEPVPEPLTILGSGMAIGFGTVFKQKIAKKKS